MVTTGYGAVACFTPPQARWEPTFGPQREQGTLVD